jgi:DNA-binding NarL/FixJ family response regulator
MAIDEHKFIREMRQLLFANHATYELTGASGTIEDGIEMVKIKRPDIVFLDINLQDKTSMSVVPAIKKM